MQCQNYDLILIASASRTHGLNNAEVGPINELGSGPVRLTPVGLITALIQLKLYNLEVVWALSAVAEEEEKKKVHGGEGFDHKFVSTMKSFQ